MGIAPSECPIYVQLLSDGSVETGINVAEVTPSPNPAGYVEPEIAIEHLSGSSSSRINLEIIDQMALKDRNVYQITFEDTTKKASKRIYEDTLTTKNFTLVNVTDIAEPDTLIDHSTKIHTGDEHLVIDGFQISFNLESVIELNSSLSKWNGGDTMIFAPIFMRWEDIGKVGYRKPSDYRLTIGDVGLGKSTQMKVAGGVVTLPAINVNFKIENITENKVLDFGFWELDTTGGTGKLTSNLDESDIIILLEDKISTSGDTTSVYTWQFKMKHLIPDSLKRHPRSGDVVDLIVKKPFLGDDLFEFTIYGPEISKKAVKSDIKQIKVVPNPYIGANTWETKNPYDSGRGPRVIHFNHVPMDCEITILNIAGEIVDQFEVHNAIDDGIAEWDLLSKDNLSISYGLYLYHVKDLLSNAVQTGKFAVIK